MAAHIPIYWWAGRPIYMFCEVLEGANGRYGDGLIRGSFEGSISTAFDRGIGSCFLS